VQSLLETRMSSSKPDIPWPQTGQIRGPEFKSDDAHQLDPTGRSRNAEAESIEESAHVDDSAESTSLYQLDSLEPAPKLDYSVCSDPDKRTLRYPRDPFAENLEFGRAREPKPHMHEMPSMRYANCHVHRRSDGQALFEEACQARTI
jgi:hypothetical protein